MIIVIILVSLIPIWMFFSYQIKRASPAEQWPLLSLDLKLVYEEDPARMTGDWSGRRAQINSLSDGVTVTMWLKTPTRLRVECGPKAAVLKRNLPVAPHPVAALEPAFQQYLARCSDKAAGHAVFDSALQGRLAYMKDVDFVGTDISVIWTVAHLKDVAEAQAILHALGAIADALEKFPTGDSPLA
jgi:hypothetical protein